jgi:hypothetical protein
VDFSDEDPDTDDWADLADVSSAEASGSGEEAGGQDGDAFMDGASSASEGEGEGEIEDGSVDSVEDLPEFAMHEDSDESGVEEEEEKGERRSGKAGYKRSRAQEEEEEEEEEGEGSADEEEAATPTKPKKTKGLGGGGLSAFASLEDYQTLIDREWSKLQAAESSNGRSQQRK